MSEIKKSAFGTAGLVLGIIGICLSFLPVINYIAFILGLLALIFGIVSLAKGASKGKAVAGLILGILSIAITVTTLLSVGKALNEVVQGWNETVSGLNATFEEMSGDQTQAILEKNLDVTLGKFTVEKGSLLDSYKMPVTLKNKGEGRKSFSVLIEAVGSDEERICTDTVYVSDLGEGQKQSQDAFTLITSDQAASLKNATFRIVEVSMY